MPWVSEIRKQVLTEAEQLVGTMIVLRLEQYWVK